MNEALFTRILSNSFEWIDLYWLSKNDYIVWKESYGDDSYYIVIKKDLTLNGTYMTAGNAFNVTVEMT